MKVIYFIILACVAGLSHAMSFVYDGFECESGRTPSTIAKKSRFEVIEELGNGSYRILFTGGLPIFSDATEPCIADLFGVETLDPNEGVAVKKTDAQAMAYFSGAHLTITLATLNAFGNSTVIGGDIITSSLVIPQIFTWIFEFVPEKTNFLLIRNIEFQGAVKIFGSLTPYPGRVIENIIMRNPTTGTSPSIIEYRLE